jgi:hypothetical protein
MGASQLRVYTGADYLERWRRFFAERMGFSSLPDCNREQAEQQDIISSPGQLRAYLNRFGISQRQLADELGLAKSLVSLRLSGRRGWTSDWQAKVARWFAQREGKVPEG